MFDDFDLDIQKIVEDNSSINMCPGPGPGSRPTQATCPMSCRWEDACHSQSREGASCGAICSLVVFCK